MTAEPRLTPAPAAPAAADGIEGRAVAATLACIARHGPRQDDPRRRRPRGRLLPGHALPLLRRASAELVVRRPSRPRRHASATRCRERSRRAGDARGRRRRGARHRRPRAARARRAAVPRSPTSPSSLLPHLTFSAATASSPQPRPRSRRASRRFGSTSAPSAPPSGSHASASRSRLAPDRPVDSPTTPTVRALRARVHRPRSRPPFSQPSTDQGVVPWPVTNQEMIGRADVNDLEAILVDHATPTSTRSSHTVRVERRRHLHVGLRAQPARAGQALREGEDVAVERATDLPWDTDVDQEKVVLANSAANSTTFGRSSTSPDTPFEKWGDKEWIEFGIESQNWTLSQFLHGEQGALICTAQIVETVPWIDAKYYAADAGDGRGPPRRGVRHVPRREAVGALPDQRAPADAARRHHRRHPLGHDLPRHADHGRGPGARRVRVHPPDDDRAAAQAAAPLRDERRGPPRRVRRALAPGVLPASSPPPRSASARSSRSRPRCACATGSSSRRSGSAWASTSRRRSSCVHAGARPRRSSSRCCSRRSCRTARSSACSTPADGWLRERFTELGVIQFEDWVDTGEEYADARRGRQGPRDRERVQPR